MLMAKIEKEGRTALLGKETSVYAAANLLDLLLNAMSTPVIPCEYFEVGNCLCLKKCALIL